MKMIQASKKLDDLLTQVHAETGGTAIVEEICSDPFVAVGLVPADELPLILIIPPALLSADVRTDRITGRRNGTLTIRRQDNMPELIQAGYIRFDTLSPAVRVVLDAITDHVISGNQHGVGQLASDFVDLFKPSSNLSDHELTGLFGELTSILEFQDKDRLISCWHERLDSKYDFALEGSRLEVKTSLGAQRIHSFSSSQLPPEDSLRVTVCSVLSEHVSDGQSVIDLWLDIQEQLTDNDSKNKLRDQVLSIIKKDILKAETTLFDYELAKGSIQFFPAEKIPTVTLSAGVLSAKWKLR